jgi:hypothetical protein
MTCMHDPGDQRYYREDNGDIVDFCGRCGEIRRITPCV